MPAWKYGYEKRTHLTASSTGAHWKAHLNNAFNAPREGRASKRDSSGLLSCEISNVSVETTALSYAESLCFRDDWRGDDKVTVGGKSLQFTVHGWALPRQWIVQSVTPLAAS